MPAPEKQRFTIADATLLKQRLKILNETLSNNRSNLHSVDFAQLIEACAPFSHSQARWYVSGSEELYIFVRSIPRADLIPIVYIRAFQDALAGRFHTNSRDTSDGTEVGGPTFSEIRVMLDEIDRLCATNLKDKYNELEDKVLAFPFLKLPAEIRLTVYMHMFAQPYLRRHHPGKTLSGFRVGLGILRANRQLHNEVKGFLRDQR